ncbi:hypothetical protein B0J18DRAFT_388998 [Chaetomium sp. MPI-SDFR-AT-0129]|nr:hypothetical protein B0J18DRAFT_388998 [Chaetomium sp. MPI-SDFR-AT-0129]
MAIAGRYPVKPAHLHLGKPIPGNDGVARVEAIGPAGTNKSSPGTTAIQPGDLVIPRRHGLGTWRRKAVLPIDGLTRLPLNKSGPSSIDPVAASMLRTVFLPAYLLAEDTRSLRPGDWVVQNAGASTIAQLVAQFIRRKGAHVVSVVRDRPDPVDQTLPDAGPVDVVLTEGQVAAFGVGAHPALEAAATQGRVVLALDAVFGESGERLAGLLSKGATFVNYGSLGGADGVLRLSQKLIFWNEIKFRNFRLTEQLGKRSEREQVTLLSWFAGLIASGELRAPAVDKIPVPLDAPSVDGFQQKVREVLTAAARKEIGYRKSVFDFVESSETQLCADN